MKVGQKIYLGDGVYAVYDGEYVILTTENGIEVTNTIYLEMNVLNSLILFIESK